MFNICNEAVLYSLPGWHEVALGRQELVTDHFLSCDDGFLEGHEMLEIPFQENHFLAAVLDNQRVRMIQLVQITIPLLFRIERNDIEAFVQARTYQPQHEVE